MPKIELIQGDCLEKMKTIPDGSIDLTVTEVLWSIALSDHLGDVAEAIEPTLKHFGMRVMSLDELIK